MRKIIKWLKKNAVKKAKTYLKKSKKKKEKYVYGKFMSPPRPVYWNKNEFV